MRGVVPQTNSELAAWNWGERLGRGGFALPWLPPGAPPEVLFPHSEPLAQALARLGGDTFARWAELGHARGTLEAG